MKFLQANRTTQSDNELVERAILDQKRLAFEMAAQDAFAVVETFKSNYISNSDELTLTQRLKIYVGNIWNSSYGNVVRFIIHMGPTNLKLYVKEGVGEEGAQLHVEYIAKTSNT